MCIFSTGKIFVYLTLWISLCQNFLVNLKFKNKDNKWDICSINEQLKKKW